MPNPPKQQSEEAVRPVPKGGDPAASGDRHDAGFPERKQGELGQGDSAQRTKE